MEVCRNTLSFLLWSFLRAHDSHPQRRVLMGIATKKRYFDFRSMKDDSYTFLNAPTCWLALSILLWMSSSFRSNLDRVPRGGVVYEPYVRYVYSVCFR